MNSPFPQSAPRPAPQLLVVEPGASGLIDRIENWRAVEARVLPPASSSASVRRTACANLQRHGARRVALLLAPTSAHGPSLWQREEDSLARRTGLARGLLAELFRQGGGELCFLSASEVSRDERHELFALMDVFACELSSSEVALRAIFLSKGKLAKVFDSTGNRPSVAA